MLTKHSQIQQLFLIKPWEVETENNYTQDNKDYEKLSDNYSKWLNTKLNLN